MLRNDLYRPWFVGEKDWGFEIIDGEYTDVVVQIEAIEFSKENEGSVDLNYHLVRKPEHLQELSSSDEMFNKTVEIIINDILREAVDSYEQIRSNDSQESSSQ
jgi:hypothetical protein